MGIDLNANTYCNYIKTELLLSSEEKLISVPDRAPVVRLRTWETVLNSYLSSRCPQPK